MKNAALMVRMLDWLSESCGFSSRSCHYQLVNTWVSRCLQTGKPSRYITNTRSTQPSIRLDYWPPWPALRWTSFTCIGWQVTLCDPIWQVMLYSSATMQCVSYSELYTPSTLYFRLLSSIDQISARAKSTWVFLVAKIASLHL